jgi:hypothetical protein
LTKGQAYGIISISNEREVIKMYFECNDWLYGTYLTKVSFLKGIYILLFGRGYAKFVPKKMIIKEER